MRVDSNRSFPVVVARIDDDARALDFEEETRVAEKSEAHDGKKTRD